MKQPSERIKEIYIQNEISYANEMRGRDFGHFWAVNDYLDEEWKKMQCQHEITICGKCDKCNIFVDNNIN